MKKYCIALLINLFCMITVTSASHAQFFDTIDRPATIDEYDEYSDNAAYDQHDRTITIYNSGDQRISWIYVVNRDSKTWGGNILNGVIWPGDSRYLSGEDFSGYCIYDFRFVFGITRQESFRHTVNLCEESSLDISNWE